MSDENLRKALRLSYALSFGAALLIGAGFFIITTLTGDYSPLTRYGGASWTFLLTLIIALPTITPALKRRFRG